MKTKAVIDPLTFYEKKQSNKEVIKYEDKKDELFKLSLNLKLFQINLSLRKRK